MTTKVRITMTEYQARHVMYAMNLYSRVLMGQFDEIKHLFFGFGEEGKLYHRDEKHWHDYFDIYLEAIKRHVYPELHPNAYWGITGFTERNKCPPQATLVFDIYKMMDYKISWYKDPKGGLTVNFDKPMHFFDKCPLPEVEVFEE